MNLILKYVGNDGWDRPVYECKENLYVDVEPRKGRCPEICTKCSNDFDGEPDTLIREGTGVKFIPSRVTWY